MSDPKSALLSCLLPCFSLTNQQAYGLAYNFYEATNLVLIV